MNTNAQWTGIILCYLYCGFRLPAGRQGFLIADLVDLKNI
jgi:hypothetical protein